MPISSHRSVVLPPTRAFSMKYSRPYFEASLATCLRSSWRSSDSVNDASCCLLLSTTASTSPAATCVPGWMLISVTVPACGALTVCCIFMASSTSTASPAATSAPCSTRTLTTVPGIGASRLPLATASAGSTNRGTRSAARGRARQSTSTALPCDRDVVRRAHAVGLERDLRGAGLDHRVAVDDVAVAAAVPLDDEVALELGALRLGRRRCATRPGCRAARCGPRPPARPARSPPRLPRCSTARPPVVEPVGTPSSRKAVLTLPARNSGSRRMATSRSRLVTTPWIFARLSAPASLRAACVRGSARRRSPWRASRRSGWRPRCRTRSRSRRGSRPRVGISKRVSSPLCGW